MRFFVGLHQPADAARVKLPCMISVNRLWERKKPLAIGDWIMDSGAFSELSTYGGYRDLRSPALYADRINRFSGDGSLRAAVAQDFMCEPFIIEKTGLSIDEHQRLTIQRYDELLPLSCAYVMPVLQGYAAADYCRHVDMYGARLTAGAWVGVGSVCKRNSRVDQIENILMQIKSMRPDLRLHGFGLKTTALRSDLVFRLLHSADSMAWSYAARREKRNANDWRNAVDFCERIARQPRQTSLFNVIENDDKYRTVDTRRTHGGAIDRPHDDIEDCARFTGAIEPDRDGTC